METWKKVNLILLVVALLMGLATVVFGQKKSSVAQLNKPIKTAQAYGDSALVAFLPVYLGDTAAIQYFPGFDLVEMRVIHFSKKGKKKMCVVKNFNKTQEHFVTFNSESYVFVRTSRGVTSIVYLRDAGTPGGYLLVNGKLVAHFDGTEINPGVESISGDYFKDRVTWAYTDTFLTDLNSDPVKSTE